MVHALNTPSDMTAATNEHFFYEPLSIAYPLEDGYDRGIPSCPLRL